MKASLSKKLLTLLIAPAFLFAFTTKVYKANFSGDWKLNESKSDLGPMAQWATRAIKTDQKDNDITINRTAPGPDGGDATTAETLSFDGKETESTVFGNSKRKASAKWSDDGNTLTVNYVLNLDFGGQAFEVKGNEIWTLSSDGKTLTVQTNASSPQGDLTAKAVYDKQ
jgi:hypothetical protein